MGTEIHTHMGYYRDSNNLCIILYILHSDRRKMTMKRWPHFRIRPVTTPSESHLKEAKHLQNQAC